MLHLKAPRLRQASSGEMCVLQARFSGAMGLSGLLFEREQRLCAAYRAVIVESVTCAQGRTGRAERV